jgi:hypothetical protein
MINISIIIVRIIRVLNTVIFLIGKLTVLIYNSTQIKLQSMS